MAWSPISWLRLLWWLFVMPQHYHAYQKEGGEVQIQHTGAWLASTLLWLPMIILTYGVNFGSVSYRIRLISWDVDRHLYYIIFIACWILTAQSTLKIFHRKVSRGTGYIILVGLTGLSINFLSNIRFISNIRDPQSFTDLGLIVLMISLGIAIAIELGDIVVIAGIGNMIYLPFFHLIFFFNSSPYLISYNILLVMTVIIIITMIKLIVNWNRHRIKSFLPGYGILATLFGSYIAFILIVTNLG